MDYKIKRTIEKRIDATLYIDCGAISSMVIRAINSWLKDMTKGQWSCYKEEYKLALRFDSTKIDNIVYEVKLKGLTIEVSHKEEIVKIMKIDNNNQ